MAPATAIACYLQFLAGLLLMYGAGFPSRILFRDRELTAQTRLLLRVTVGFLIVTSLLAVLATAGRTVMVLNLVLLPLLMDTKQEPNEKKGSHGRQLLSLAILGTLVFLLAFVGGRGMEPNRIFFADQYFYAIISSRMVESGQESPQTYLQEFDSTPLHPRPYHPLDLWTGAVMSLFDLSRPSIETQIYQTHAVLWTLAALAYAALAAEGRVGPKGKVGLMGIAGLAIRGVQLPDIAVCGTMFFTPLANLLSCPKLSVYCIFLAAFTILYLRQHRTQAIRIMLFGAVASATAWIGILGSAFTLGIWNLWRGRVDKNAGSFTLMMAVALGTSLLGFYRLTGQGTGVTPSLAPAAVAAAAVKGLLMLGFALLALSAIIFAGGKLTALEKELLCCYAVILGASCVAWAVGYFIVDGIQLFTNLAFPLISVAFFWASCRLMAAHPRGGSVTLLVLTIYGLSLTTFHGTVNQPSKVSPAFRACVEKMTSNSPGLVRIGVLWSKFDRDSPYAGKTGLLAIDRAREFLRDPRVRLVSIADANLVFSEVETIRADQLRELEQQPLWRSLKSSGRGYEEDVLRFLDRHGIDFLLVSDDTTLPTQLEAELGPHVRDEQLGLTFYRLSGNKR